MKNRLSAVLMCVLFLGAGLPPALGDEPTPPAVTIQYFEGGTWYPLLIPDDTPLTAEGLPGVITGVDIENQSWQVPVRWDLEEHQGEIAACQDFTLHASPEDTLTGPGDTIRPIRTVGPAGSPFELPVYYFRRGPIGTDPRLSGLTGSYAPWRGLLTLTYNKVGTLEAAPPDAQLVLIQASTDLVSWETVLDVTGEAGGRFDVEPPAQRAEDLYYRVWVEGGPQAGASTEYVVMEANARQPKAHTVTLEEGLVVGEGEDVVYLTVADHLLDAPEDGLYPGGLTIQVDGQIVVEAGGSLTIGTFSSGGPEQRPVMQGAPLQDGLIRVEPGGALKLDGVTWELDGGEGRAILQEDGGLVELFHTELDPALIQWGAPVVDNGDLVVEDVWLEAGTPLTEALLPQDAEARVLDRGSPARLVLPIRWELGEDAGRGEGEAVIAGSFLNEAGEPMSALAPLEAVIHWYTPEAIPLTGTAWLGDAAPAARLDFKELPPQAAELWAEWSEVDGAVWTRWDSCEFRENDSGPYCVLTPPDSRPRLYRVAGVSADGTRHWASKGVLLPPADTVPEDPDGNRGGSTGVVRPDREPEPEETPAPAPTPPTPSQPDVPPEPALPSAPAPEPTEAPVPETPSELPPPSDPPEVPAVAPQTAPPQGREPLDETDRHTAPAAPEVPPEDGTAAEPRDTLPPAAAGAEQALTPEPSDAPPPQQGSPAPSAPAESGERDPSPPAPVQRGLAAAGLGVCVLAGLGASRRLKR